MVKFRRSLLVVLVFICAIGMSAWVVNGHASPIKHNVTPQSVRYTGPSTEGEPDAGSGKEPPKQQTAHSGGISGWNDAWRQSGRWIRWTSGIWMARNLGVIRF
jgi:hypothetical protein